MGGIRIRWKSLAKVAAALVAAAVALQLLPGLLKAPEPPPLGADVGLPRVADRGEGLRVERRAERRRAPRSRANGRGDIAHAVIGTRTHRRPARRQRHAHPTPKPPASPPRFHPEPASASTPAPEPPTPEPPPPPSPPPTPAPTQPASDGSMEFAPR